MKNKEIAELLGTGLGLEDEEVLVAENILNEFVPKNKLRIVHGTTEHGYAERLDCLICLEVEIEYLQAIKKAGGREKFIDSKLSELKKINTILEKEVKQ